MSQHFTFAGHGRTRGLTFIEVLATITLMAIVLPAVMQGLNLALGAAGLTRQRAEATALAEGKLNELLVTGQWQSPALSGDFGQDWPMHRWQASTTDWEEPGLARLHVAVTWTYHGGERQVELDTLVYTGSSTGTTAGGTGP